MTDQAKAAGWVVQFSFTQPVTNNFGAGPPTREFYNVAIETAGKAVDAAKAKRKAAEDDTEIFVVRPLSRTELDFLKLAPGEIKSA